MLLLCFLFGTGLGTYQLYRGLTAGPRIDIDAAQLEAGAPAPGVWLRIRGQALWSQVASQDDGSGSARHYVPVVSGTIQSKHEPRVFLEFQGDLPKGGAGEAFFDGTVIGDRGVPRDIERDFAREGIILKSRRIMLESGGTPQGLVHRSFIGFTIGGFSLAMIPVIGRLRRRKLLP